jgi:hypothetical protein
MTRVQQGLLASVLIVLVGAGLRWLRRVADPVAARYGQPHLRR